MQSILGAKLAFVNAMSSLVLATAGYDHTIRFWEATTGICWRTIPHNDSHVNKLEISQDKKYLAAAGNPAVRVYDIQSNATSPFYTFQGHTSNVSAIGFNKEGRWLYSGAPTASSASHDATAGGITCTASRDYCSLTPGCDVRVRRQDGEDLGHPHAG